VLNEAATSNYVVRLRLVNGKIALVHRRLWPALVRLVDRVGPEALAAVYEEHTSAGAHRARTVAFPDWVPQPVLERAPRLSEADAIQQLPDGVLPG
jgi:hypothetical protein